MESEESFLSKEEQAAIIGRCENMLKQHQQIYFDVIEFENLIDYYLESENISKAETVLNIACKQHPKCEELEMRRAKILLEQEQFQQALDLLNCLDKIEKDNSDILFMKAICYINQSEYDIAINLFDKAIKLSPELAENSIYNFALAFIDQNQYKIALKYLEQALNIDTSNDMIYFQIGYCYENLENYQSAIEFYEKHITQNPYAEITWINLGVIYNKLKDFDNAIKSIQYALAINPQNALAHYNLANCYANCEKFDNAIEEYKEVLEYEPNNIQAIYYLGECYEKLSYTEALDSLFYCKHQETAYNYFKRTTTINRRFADGWYGMAIICYNQKKYEEGLLNIKNALLISPDNAEYWFFHGEVNYEIEENKSDCLSSYKRAIELQPQDSLYWLSYATATSTIKDLESAIKILKKALEIINNDAEILFTLAAYYAKAKEKDLAETYFIKGIKTDCSMIDAFFETCKITEEEKIEYTNLLKKYNSYE